VLKRITLRDFVIVRELELELAGGFSVLTGETGAGKSILVDALQLALGELGKLMTTGQRVTPAKALFGEYIFHYPTLEPALRAILAKEYRRV